MDPQTRLLTLLRSCGFDTGALPPEARAEAHELARKCHIELPRPGVAWPNIAGSNVLAAPVTHVDPRRP